MTLRVGSIVLGVSDVRRAVSFWCRALDYRPREDPDTTWAVLTPVERLIALGASLVEWPDYPDGADFVVLADPEGNLFCVIDKGR